jgi:hypothetical protein
MPRVCRLKVRRQRDCLRAVLIVAGMNPVSIMSRVGNLSVAGISSDLPSLATTSYFV